MQLLAELGLPGAALWLLFVGGALVRGLWARRRAVGPDIQAAIAALMLGTLSWFIHSSGDWLWQLAGVSWPAILLLGGLAGVATTGVNATGCSGDNGAALYFRTVRLGGLLCAGLVFASAFFPYVALRYNDLALRAGAEDLTASLRAAGRAATLDPLSPAPLVARAHALAAASTRDDAYREGIRIDLLGLRMLALEEARQRDPSSWSLALQTGEAALAYRDAVAERPESAEQSNDAGQEAAASAFGLAEQDLVQLGPLEGLEIEELTDRARTHLVAARHLNPRAPEIEAKLSALNGG
jgi:hypothetical protein